MSNVYILYFIQCKVSDAKDVQALNQITDELSFAKSPPKTIVFPIIKSPSPQLSSLMHFSQAKHELIVIGYKHKVTSAPNWREKKILCEPMVWVT